MPRPSSPVHAKASTKCSYLTLENPHHQRQACIKPSVFATARRIISARCYICSAAFASSAQRPRETNAPRHRFKNPFTMSKTAARGRLPARCRISLLHPGDVAAWWSQSGSNRRPQACKASALPTELWPPRRQQRWEWWAEEDSNLRPYAYQAYALTT